MPGACEALVEMTRERMTVTLNPWMMMRLGTPTLEQAGDVYVETL